MQVSPITLVQKLTTTETYILIKFIQLEFNRAISKKSVVFKQKMYDHAQCMYIYYFDHTNSVLNICAKICMDFTCVGGNVHNTLL